MTEQRRADTAAVAEAGGHASVPSRPPHAVEDAAMANHASDAFDDGDFEQVPAAQLPPVAPHEGARPSRIPISSRPPPHDGDAPETRRRPKPRAGLRIPDDEISRPVATKPPPAVAPVMAQPIITINPPGGFVTPEEELTELAADEPTDFDGVEVDAASSDEMIPIVSDPPEAPTSGEEIPILDDDMAPPSPRPALGSEPQVQADSGPRRSDPDASEVLPEDLETSEPEPVPPKRIVPAPPPPPAAAAKPAVPRAPLVIVPPRVGHTPPSPPESPTSRRKVRPWWEDLFNDDYIRTMAKVTDEQIAKEVDFIEDSLGVAKGGTMLDLACGTGRHAIELSRRGYEVVGLDLSLAMLARAADEAQERGQKLNFVQGDMREMTFEEVFDGVLCWNTSFGFFEEEKNIQVINRVHRALKRGGQFMLDVANRDYLIHQAPSLAWFEGDGCVCMDEMQIDWMTSRMRVKRTLMMDDGRTREIEYSIRIYSMHELGKILHDNGFRVCEISGRTGTPGVFFGTESPRTLVLAEKR